ncbi:unnamed protein product, partial [Boreogadus saida]
CPSDVSVASGGVSSYLEAWVCIARCSCASGNLPSEHPHLGTPRLLRRRREDREKGEEREW